MFLGQITETYHPTPENTWPFLGIIKGQWWFNKREIRPSFLGLVALGGLDSHHNLRSRKCGYSKGWASGQATEVSLVAIHLDHREKKTLICCFGGWEKITNMFPPNGGELNGDLPSQKPKKITNSRNTRNPRHERFRKFVFRQKVQWLNTRVKMWAMLPPFPWKQPSGCYETFGSWGSQVTVPLKKKLKTSGGSHFNA